jgi:hypothetical protein
MGVLVFSAIVNVSISKPKRESMGMISTSTSFARLTRAERSFEHLLNVKY